LVELKTVSPEKQSNNLSVSPLGNLEKNYLNGYNSPEVDDFTKDYLENSPMGDTMANENVTTYFSKNTLLSPSPVKKPPPKPKTGLFKIEAVTDSHSEASSSLTDP
jgi:hypothetical protein